MVVFTFVSLSHVAKASAPSNLRGLSGRERPFDFKRPSGRKDGPATVTTRGGLPGNVAPRHYRLWVEEDIPTLTFSGRVIIDLEVLEDTDTITLNTNGINITKTTLTARLKSTESIVFDEPGIVESTANDTTTFVLADASPKPSLTVLPAGTTAQLDLTYKGLLRNDLYGFYPASFSWPNGTDGLFTTTQFETKGARRAFPSFDEPALKATFTISLIANSDLTCISNMDLANVTDVQDGAKKEFNFKTSPLMPTYLVAYSCGPLSFAETKSWRVPIRIYAPPGFDIDTADHQLEVAVEAMTYFEALFGIEYPMPKLDLLGLTDFDAGGMENWGLVTFQAPYLFVTPNTTASRKIGWENVVFHELAHQWFGDLVTMDWWNDIWLNEGFAEYFATVGQAHFNPEYQVWDDYIMGDYAYAASYDGFLTSHPVRIPREVGMDLEINYFDDIIYCKGSVVLRMISNYLGESAFTTGLQKYLRAKQFKNAVTNDLLDAWKGVSDKDIDGVVRPWITETGYPVVSVTEDGSKLRLEQHRFLSTGNLTAEADTVYPIVLNLKTSAGVDNAIVIGSRSAEVPLRDSSFYLLNANYTGFWRVHYPPARLAKIISQAAEGLLTISERAGLVSDAAALAASGIQSTSGLLDMLAGFGAGEKSYFVWEALLAAVRSARWAFLSDDAITAKIDALTRNATAGIVQSVGWGVSVMSDTEQQQMLKVLLFERAGRAGNEAIVAAAKDMFWQLVNETGTVDPNLLSNVLWIGVQFGGVAEYDAVLDYYNRTEATAALQALGATSDPALLQRTLDFILDPSVPDGSKSSILSGLSSGGKAQISASLDWFISHYPDLEELYPGDPESVIEDISYYVTLRLFTQAQVDRARAFFASLPPDNTEGALYQGSTYVKRNLEVAEAQAQWGERDAKEVKAWFGLP